MDDHPKTITLEPAPGSSIVVDHLEGPAPAYVYMHGLTSERTGEKSDALLDHAGRRGRGYARFDFRGHGQSSGELGSVTVSELIEDGAAVLQHVGPSIVVGSSLGGLIAGWLAKRCPDLVRGLVLLSPAFGFLAQMAGHPREDGMVIVTGDGKHIQLENRVLDDAVQYDEATLPRHFTMPVLLVHGERDDTVPAIESRRCFEGIPHERKILWLIPDGDHALDESIRDVYRRMDELLG